jgi:hypothetical protein
MNINFEIVDINEQLGVAYVKFWADGATVERFGADIGPYEILMLPDCEIMEEQQFLEHIARWGHPIVIKQYDAINAKNRGVTSKFEGLVGKQQQVYITDE